MALDINSGEGNVERGFGPELNAMDKDYHSLQSIQALHSLYKVIYELDTERTHELVSILDDIICEPFVAPEEYAIEVRPWSRRSQEVPLDVEVCDDGRWSRAYPETSLYESVVSFRRSEPYFRGRFLERESSPAAIYVYSEDRMIRVKANRDSTIGLVVDDEKRHDDEVAETSLKPEQEQGENSPQEIRNILSTYLVTEALLMVSESKAELTPQDIIDKLQNQSDVTDAELIQEVVESMFAHDSPYLMKSEDEEYETMLTANGIALIEDAFMNGEEDIDQYEVAKSQLDKSKFLHRINSLYLETFL